LYSQTRFSKFKLKLRQNDDDSDVLRCAKTGATDRGILVVETSRNDGKDLSKYVQIKRIVEDILHGRRSPLVRTPMSGQWKAVKGLMAKKRDGKTMAASDKELSTETAAPPCERQTLSEALETVLLAGVQAAKVVKIIRSPGEAMHCAKNKINTAWKIHQQKYTV
jgi:hypothetical protein